MKIAFMNMYSGLVNRGVERSISELAKHLNYKYHVTVFQGKFEVREYPIQKISLNIDLTKVNQTTFGWLKFLKPFSYESRKVAEFSLKTLPYLWREKYDVVIPTNGSWQSLICRLLTWLQGKKMLITGRSGPGWDERLNLLCQPDAFVALTPAHQKWAQQYFPKSKISQIPNGVDLEKFTPHIKPLKIELDKPIILTVGAISPWKRHELVLAALCRLKNVSWLLVGGGDDKYKLQFLLEAKKRLGKRFLWMQLPLDKMPQVYPTAQVFTSAVRPEEAFGNVFLEALACNLPVVTADDPSRKYIVGDAGILVDVTNADKFAAALKKALDIKWYHQPRRQAEKFSWVEVARQYDDLFKSII